MRWANTATSAIPRQDIDLPWLVQKNGRGWQALCRFLFAASTWLLTARLTTSGCRAAPAAWRLSPGARAHADFPKTRGFRHSPLALLLPQEKDREGCPEARLHS